MGERARRQNSTFPVAAAQRLLRAYPQEQQRALNDLPAALGLSRRTLFRVLARERLPWHTADSRQRASAAVRQAARLMASAEHLVRSRG